MREGRLRRLVPLLGLVAGGAVAAIAVGEIGARILVSLGQAETSDAESLRLEPAESAEDGGRGDLPELESIFELASPGVEGIYRGAYYRTNSLGFRGPEYDRQPPSGVFRIVAIGDSFVMGEGVLEEEAYAAVLADLLAPDVGRVQVLNLGISGANIHHAVDRLEGLGLSLHPDLIVYGMTSNDIEVEGYRMSISTETIRAQRARFARFAESPSYLLRLLWPRWVSFRTSIAPARGTYLYEVLDNYLRNPAAWSRFAEGFDRLAAIQRDAGVPVVVFVHPILAYLRAFHPFDEVYAKVERAARRRGLAVVQGYPAVAGRAAESLWISGSNPHPNARAHALFAETLRDGLLRTPGLLPEPDAGGA